MPQIDLSAIKVILEHLSDGKYLTSDRIDFSDEYDFQQRNGDKKMIVVSKSQKKKIDEMMAKITYASLELDDTYTDLEDFLNEIEREEL